MLGKDWVKDAAEEITIQEYPMEIDEVIQVIKNHCPFRIDTSYQEVGADSKKLDEILEISKYLRRNM